MDNEGSNDDLLENNYSNLNSGGSQINGSLEENAQYRYKITKKEENSLDNAYQKLMKSREDYKTYWKNLVGVFIYSHFNHIIKNTSRIGLLMAKIFFKPFFMFISIRQVLLLNPNGVLNLPSHNKIHIITHN